MSTDNISSPDAEPAPPLPEPLPEPPVAARRISPWLFVAVLALALAGWQWLETRQQLDETRREVARRLADADTAGKEERGARGQLLEQIEDLQAKFGVVDSRLAEFESQGKALQSMVEDLARSREEATLLEVEQALTLAQQQLQLAGNVAVAALALQTADARLARLDKPRYLPLRDALAKDLGRLNAQPFVDVAGISLRLEEIIGRVDELPLLALDRPAAAAKSVPTEAEAGAAWWRLAAADAWQALRDLIRIQRLDREEPVLLAPEQSFFLRENLKLRLLNARLALLARDHGTFRSELKVAQDWLQRYFAADDPAVKEAQGKLQQLLAADPGADLPSLSDSLAVLVKLRGGKDAR
ncbi:MAG: uroporphyrinogen-III C-methyltransferase [Azonexus sp.]|jgi:uroporphyrin-3 C-methyltransferase|uniref:uroporphyrinogen-III C-methyltransferase n=1 Tax=Azonexus sp. TaxID=1872668 RepID=UPI002834CBE3|nr:uroporphyrinogen-III C-methyltransferase [Azonexus sp.]MDR0776639.1 uroporphyrinogen-III C-methyltransferase [Azonexus sp.]